MTRPDPIDPTGQLKPRGSVMNQEERDAEDCHRSGRRRFLAAGLAAGFGPIVVRGGEAAPGRDDPAVANGDVAAPATGVVPVRRFGKTGLTLPILAFGGSAMVDKWQVTYGPQLPFGRRVAMVRHAFDSGDRYFDTPPNYGESEAILGEALRDVRK